MRVGWHVRSAYQIELKDFVTVVGRDINTAMHNPTSTGAAHC